MMRQPRFLMSVALATIMSFPAFAQESGAPNPDLAAAEQPPVPAVEPPVSEEQAAAETPAPAECAEGGALAEEPTEALSAFYRPESSSITQNETGLVVDHAEGAMVVNSVTYQLQSIIFPRQPAIPVSSERYDMEVRFIHAADDGSTAVLSVPVRAGKANYGLENILSGRDIASVNPNDFLPETRQYAPMGKSFGPDCLPQQTVQYFLLIHPIEVSAAQIEKFQNSFDAGAL